MVQQLRLHPKLSPGSHVAAAFLWADGHQSRGQPPCPATSQPPFGSCPVVPRLSQAKKTKASGFHQPPQRIILLFRFIRSAVRLFLLFSVPTTKYCFCAKNDVKLLLGGLFCNVQWMKWNVLGACMKLWKASNSLSRQLAERNNGLKRGSWTYILCPTDVTSIEQALALHCALKCRLMP